MKKYLNSIALALAWTAGSQAGEDLKSPIIFNDIKSMDPKAMVDDCWDCGDPLSIDDGLVVFDFQLRWRLENRNNWIDFNDNYDLRDDMALLQRIRAGIEINPVEWFTFYTQFQSSMTFFDEPGGPLHNREFVTIDDPYQLHQLYVEFGKFTDPDFQWNLKLGRQKLVYEQQRLVGSFEWDNIARVFDAVKAQYRNENVQIDYFAGFVVVPESDNFNSPDTQDLFMGIYDHNKFVKGFKKADLFLFFRSKSDRTASTVFTNQDNQVLGNGSPIGDYFTFGTLWESDAKVFGPWDFNTEIVGQAGTINNPVGLGPVVGGVPIDTGRQNLLAFAAHVEGGYTFKADWKPRVFAMFDFATGDNDPSDGTSNTFQNLFPTNHLYYGYMDRFSWQNMISPSFGFQCKPVKGLLLKSQAHFFWLDTTNDPWRFAGQGIVGGGARYSRALTNNPSNYVGAEIDLLAKYKVSDCMSILAGYSHFFTGSYIQETAPPYGGNRAADDADFFYLQTQFDF